MITQVNFNIKDKNEAEAELSGSFWLLREDMDNFQAEMEELINKYAI